MQDDEQAIRALFDDWIRATTEGDLELARRCIADDAVFLVPGVPGGSPGGGEMDKESFAQAAAGQSPEESPYHFDLDSQLREVQVLGDHAQGGRGGHDDGRALAVGPPEAGRPVADLPGREYANCCSGIGLAIGWLGP